MHQFSLLFISLFCIITTNCKLKFKWFKCKTCLCCTTFFKQLQPTQCGPGGAGQRRVRGGSRGGFVRLLQHRVLPDCQGHGLQPVRCQREDAVDVVRLEDFRVCFCLNVAKYNKVKSFYYFYQFLF